MTLSSLNDDRSWFKQLFELSPDPTWIIDDNKFIECNDAAVKTLGYASREAFLNVHPSKLSPPIQHDGEDSYVKAERMMAIAKDSGVHRFEWTHTRADGSDFLAEVTLSAVEVEGRNLIYCVWRDITGRKQMESALRESEARFRDLTEMSSDFYWETDSEHRIRTRTESKREAAESVFMQAASVGKRRWEISYLSPDEAGWEAHRAILDAHLPFRDFEISRLRANGAVHHISISGNPVFDASGRFKGYHGVGTDITESKQAEAARASLELQLRESQKMEAIGTLAGGIAHDFNNALATILGNVELARQDVSTNPLALESLEEIRKAGSRTRDLVQQILSFSRRQPIERKLTALAPVIEESVRLLRASLPARLTLDVHCDTDVPAVQADAPQLQQVLINLATNAMQAMRSGPGRIGIRLDAVELGTELAEAHPALRAMHSRRAGRAARLAVSDDGPGMDGATLTRIFEPFFTTKPVGEGTGLGLSVVHGIVQSHDGAIVVDSMPEKGTTFALYLPAAEMPAETPESSLCAAAGPELNPDGGQHILYIDDDESLVFLIQRLLERRGFRVSGYVNQRAALAALRADPAAFSLVVSDYNMPGMSGLDVAREVRTIRADLPMAVASGFIDEELRTQAGGAGVRELIFKADAVEDLCDAFVRLTQVTGMNTKPL
jgi:PAS domain S-box-containing protein